MRTRSSEPTTQPLATAPLLGAAPLVRGENLRSYDQLLDRICSTLQPQDALEEIWIRDIVDLVWETLRLRRARANLITDATHTRLESELHGHRDARKIAQEWAAGNEDAALQAERALAAAGLSMDRLAARAMEYTFKYTERLDRALVTVEMRRSAALRDLAKYRAPLTQKLRQAIAQAEPAELVPDAPRLAAPQPV